MLVILAACTFAPAAAPLSFQGCLTLDEIYATLPSGNPTPEVSSESLAKPTATPAVPPASAEAAPVPTPTITRSPENLPAISPANVPDGGFELVASWTPERTGPFGRVAVGEHDGERHAFIQIGDMLHLMRLMPEGVPQQTDGRIGPIMGSVRALDWDENWLAVWSTTEEHSIVLFYDVSDVENPCLVSFTPDVQTFHDLDGGRAYLRRDSDEYGPDLIVLTDVASPEKEVGIADTGYEPTSGDDRIRFITNATVNDDIAYFNLFERSGTFFESKFASLDLTNPESPRWLSESQVYGGSTYVVDDYAYTVREDVGVRIIDVSDLENLRVVGELSEDSPGYGSSTDPMEPGGLIVDGSRMYALLWGGDYGVYSWRLRVADISDPTKPTELGRYEGRGTSFGMWRQGDELVVVDEYGMSILNVSEPSNIHEIERIPAGGGPAAVFLEDSFAYVFLRSGIFVLDLDNDARLTEILLPGPIGRVQQITGGFDVGIYGASKTYGLDVSDPSRPVMTGPKRRGLAIDRPALGPYVYHSSCGSLSVQDTSAGESPTVWVTQIRVREQDCREKWDLTLYEGFAYLVGGGSLFIFDTSSPSSPVLMSGLAIGPGERDIEQARIVIENDQAYMLHGGLWVFELEEPERPGVRAYYETDARVLDVDGDRIALVRPNGTFELLDAGSFNN